MLQYRLYRSGYNFTYIQIIVRSGITYVVHVCIQTYIHIYIIYIYVHVDEEREQRETCFGECVYIYVYVYMYVPLCVRIYTYTHTCREQGRNIVSYTYSCIDMYICTYIDLI